MNNRFSLPLINLRHIHDAISHYSTRRYSYIEVPWLVSKESLAITMPPGRRSFETFAGCFVASGEQSFLHMREHLPPSWIGYQCVTPCFRDDDPDELHRMWFLKNELMWVLEVDQDYTPILEQTIKDATEFFTKYLPVKVIETDIGKDIVSLQNIELGSYGYREYDGFRWVYGTGCAEPRLSQVITIHEKWMVQQEFENFCVS